MDFSQFNAAEQAHMSRVIEKKQMQDFMRMYSSLVERCFTSCCNDFTSKALSSKEHSERVGARFAEQNADKDAFKRSKVEIIGISHDSVATLKDFAAKQKATYPILSDEKGEARKAYQVGRGLFGLTDARVTYFIDKSGVIRDAIDATVNYGAHVKFVQQCIENMEAEEKKAAEPTAAEPTAAEPTAAEPTAAAPTAAEPAPTASATDAPTSDVPATTQAAPLAAEESSTPVAAAS
ncbi:hypothetical protein EW146_g2022 [Bondarzewia mesenterica]|uniref:Thioredoxin domain-containing protein n=1 Tax=Bondarzewia mesenterica TaxID=1095465 RepID=A0A4V3XFW3_9AGAM|nr:hypothetical protein EW146_g2022 [Bondarzewia mesenterica]